MWSLSFEYIFSAVILPFIPLVALCILLCKVLQLIKARYVFFSIGLGLACFPLIVIFQSLLPAGSIMPLGLLFFTALIEELVKTLSLYLLPRKKLTLQSFFPLAIIVGVTLGSFETIAYQTTAWQSILLRTVTAVLLHAVCTGLASFFVWTRQRNTKKTSPLAMAIIIHTSYNYFASFTGMFLQWFMLVCIALGIVLCSIQYTTEKKAS